MTDKEKLEKALKALKFYRSIAKIPPGPGGSTVPVMKAVQKFEALCDEILGKA